MIREASMSASSLAFEINLHVSLLLYASFKNINTYIDKDGDQTESRRCSRCRWCCSCEAQKGSVEHKRARRYGIVDAVHG